MEARSILNKHLKRSAFKKYGPDYAVLCVAGGMALGFYLLPPLPQHLFIVKDNLGAIDPADAFPLRKEIIPMWLSGLISIAAGLIIIGAAQIWVRSGKDFHRGFLGLLISIVASSWFQVICKILIGGLRPNFLSTCQPDISKAQGQGYGGMYYDKSVCTGDMDQVLDGLESFPSGHSNCAFAGLLYLSLYLNAKLKLFGPVYPRTWKLFVVCAPTLAATILSLSRLLDYTHHWYDILAGALIGIFFAFAGYRMQYSSIFNSENNHVLLPRRVKKVLLPISTNNNYQAVYRQGDAVV